MPSTFFHDEKDRLRVIPGAGSGKVSANVDSGDQNSVRSKLLAKKKKQAVPQVPWHKRDSVWDDLRTVSTKVEDEMKQNVTDIANKSGIPSGYPREKLTEVLQWTVGELDLNFQNEDWPSLAGDMSYRHKTPVATFNEIVERTLNSAYYWIDKHYGFEKPTRDSNMSEGEKIGAALWDEVVEAPKAAYLNQFTEKEKRLWRNVAKKAIIKSVREYRKLLNKRLQGHFQDKSIYI